VPALRLAAETTRPTSRWRPLVAGTARHPFVPRWWEKLTMDGDGTGEWALRDGPADPERWLAVAYANRSPITQVAGVHADLASEPTVTGRPPRRPCRCCW
jgi:hypothetical protein